jgi:signal transduction histidine kinase
MPKKLFQFSNGFVALAILANLTNLVLYCRAQMPQAVWLQCGGIALLLVCVLLNYLQLYKLSKFVALVAVNGQMLFLSNMVGVNSCNFMYLFPFIFSQLFFLRNTDFHWQSALPPTVTSLNLFAIFIFLPFDVSSNFPHYNAQLHVTINVLINFCLMVLFYGIIFNIIKKRETKIKETNDTLQNALQTKSRFLSNISHELRTPLNGIIGSVQVLEADKNTLTQNEYFEAIKNSSQHLLHLINQTLDYSKLEFNGVQINNATFNLYDSVHNAVAACQILAKNKNLQLNINIADSLPAIYTGDNLKIEQVLLNLLSNAIKFSQNGAININLRGVLANNNQFLVTFTIADNGIGISPDMQEKVFDSFVQQDSNTTRKYGGTGLGLTICKQLVEGMGGKIALTSNEPKGTIATVILPLAYNAQQNNMALNTAKQIHQLNNLKILLAEDNKVNQMVATKMLQNWGAIVTVTNNGVEALQCFNQHQFDIALIDLEMPEMDGRQLIKHIKTTHPNFPAIAFTAAAYDNIFDDLKNLGFADFVPKPFSVWQLNHSIVGALGD